MRDLRRIVPFAFLVLVAAAGSGCPVTPVTPDGGATTNTTTTTTLGLGEEADEVWVEVLGMWEETGRYRAHEVSEETLARAQGRVAGLLLRLGAVDGVLREAPGLLELLGVEFDERLGREPAEAVCAAEGGMRTAAGQAWERLAERVEAAEALAERDTGARGCASRSCRGWRRTRGRSCGGERGGRLADGGRAGAGGVAGGSGRGAGPGGAALSVLAER